jgi:hypothetical protein
MMQPQIAITAGVRQVVGRAAVTVDIGIFLSLRGDAAAKSSASCAPAQTIIGDRIHLRHA